jgi:7-cyano-7-deazaguanine synthase
MNKKYFGEAKSLTVLLSGGIDSAVLLYAAVAEGKAVSLLHFDYGKVFGEHEKGFVKKSMRKFLCPMEIVDMKGVRAMQVGYLHPWQLDFDAEDVKDIEVVPYRDITGFYSLLSTGMYHCQITDSKHIATGLIEHQTSRRPDLRKGIDLLEESVALFNPNADSVVVHTPFINISKSELIKIGAKLGVPFQETWSCCSTAAKLSHCGECHQCKSRKKSFKEANVDDPTIYVV